MSKIHIFDRPLIRHKLSYIRDVNTDTKEFREFVDEVGMLMIYKVTRDLELRNADIETSVTKMTAKRLAGKKLTIVSTLRADLGMTGDILSLVPAARVGHIGLYQDPETLKAVGYFIRLPQDIAERQIIVVNPMLTTGISTIEAITLLKRRDAKNIRFMCLTAAPESVEKMREARPNMDIYIAALDEKLNDKAYITSGLGDAGDRLFGTEQKNRG